jgi:uncharacterized protein (DUF305 family)
MPDLFRPRRHRQVPAHLAIVSLLGIAAAACSSNDDKSSGTSAPVVQLGAPGETNRVLTDDEVGSLDIPAYTEADVAFVTQMIPHHRQALEMTALVEARSDRADLPRMAERIDVSQRDEIEQLERWLRERGEDVPTVDDAHADHAGTMPGLMTAGELAQLSSARGDEFDRLFLQYMIRHHEGAVFMVDQLLAGFGGQESEVFQLAQHIESDQAIEIARMKRLLNDI